MRERRIDVERLSAEAEAEKLERALESGLETDADRKLWTEQFAASGKQGKIPN